MIDHVGECHVGAIARLAILHLDGRLIGVDPASGHRNGRDPEQLGVLEPDAGGDLDAVVEEDAQAPCLEIGDQLLGGGALRPALLAGHHDVDVSGCNLARPAQSDLVTRRLGDRRKASRDADAVRAHRRRGGFPVLALDPQVECLGVLAAELEDVSDLDPAGDLDR